MSDTPRTDCMVTGNSDPTREEYEDLAGFTRQLERENARLASALREIMAYTDPVEDRAYVIAEAALTS